MQDLPALVTSPRDQVTCNTVDCIQNVFSKKLLAHQYTPVELQFYTRLGVRLFS